MAILIPANENIDISIIEYQGPEIGLTKLQKAVGGYIVLVYVGSTILVVDEEGMVKNKEPNFRATKLACLHPEANVIKGGNILLGDVVVLSQGEIS